MFLTLIKNNVRIKSRIFLFAAIFFLICTAGCNKTTPDPQVYSSHFKKIFDTVNYISDKNPDRGIRYLDSAYQTIVNPSVNDNFRRLSYHFVLAQKYKRDFRQSLIYADSMLSYINMNGGQQACPANFAEANFAKGDAFFELHDYNDAYRYYYYGYEIGKNHLNKTVLAAYSYRMGMITYQQSNYASAANFFKESYSQSADLDKDFVGFFV